MSKFTRAFGYFSLGLGISLVVGYWLKQEELRSRQASERIPSTQTPKPPPTVIRSESKNGASPSKQQTAPSMPTPTAPKPNTGSNLPNDLTAIRGIGPKTADILHTLGIHSYHDLATTDAATLLDNLSGQVRGINADKLADWQQQANQLDS